MKLPHIIQGGMGVGVSGWQLANAVSSLGHLGVVSGTGINSTFIRRLQDGDVGGHLRRALSAFPIRKYAEEILRSFFVLGGRDPGTAYQLSSLPTVKPGNRFQRIMAIAAFVEVFLAKENHDGDVGINFLEKLQLSNLPGIYGAMLAGVDYVLIGAGIPREIPGVLDRFSKNQSASIKVSVVGQIPGAEEVVTEFAPATVFPELEIKSLKRPKFLAIVSSATLAQHLMKKSNGKVDGFIVEGPTAGGHNAPPRGPMKLNETGEPIYGARDQPDLSAFRDLEVPFWLAGSFGTLDKVKSAQDSGAVGVQVGTAFAFCAESGLSEKYKRNVIDRVIAKSELAPASVFTDPLASPTDFPFKVVQLSETLSELEVYQSRPRKCDLGYLRQVVMQPDGAIIYRCPGEPVNEFIEKGGSVEQTHGRKCLCNALMSNIGLPQIQSGGFIEPALLTAGDDLVQLKRYLHNGKRTYTAEDVIRTLTLNAS